MSERLPREGCFWQFLARAGTAKNRRVNRRFAEELRIGELWGVVWVFHLLGSEHDSRVYKQEDCDLSGGRGSLGISLTRH